MGVAGLEAMDNRQRADVAIEIAKELPPEEQKRLASNGINESVWPQNSKDRRLTIIYSVLGAVVVFGLVGIFDILGAADSLITGGIAVCTAIIGGIFGYAKQP